MLQLRLLQLGLRMAYKAMQSRLAAAAAAAGGARPRWEKQVPDICSSLVRNIKQFTCCCLLPQRWCTSYAFTVTMYSA
jgi:hypothetical protein